MGYWDGGFTRNPCRLIMLGNYYSLLFALSTHNCIILYIFKRSDGQGDLCYANLQQKESIKYVIQ